VAICSVHGCALSDAGVSPIIIMSRIEIWCRVGRVERCVDVRVERYDTGRLRETCGLPESKNQHKEEEESDGYCCEIAIKQHHVTIVYMNVRTTLVLCGEPFEPTM
jgi:hypothetical protein